MAYDRRFGSFQLEFKYLSHHLKDPIYSEKVDKVMEFLYSLETNQGLYPTYINPQTGKFTNDLVSYGGLGDSFYEYLLKLYILTGKKDERTKQLYLTAVDGMMNNMLDWSVPSGLPFIGEYKLNSKYIINEMDHLVSRKVIVLGIARHFVAAD
jgi:mannosyl-oligosaccharide alpha-1,2-mannosidase